MELDEFIKKHRIGYNCNNKAMGLFEYYDFEKKVFGHITKRRFSIIKKSRQMHMTHMLATYTAWHMLTNENENNRIILYISPKRDESICFKLKVDELLDNYYGRVPFCQVIRDTKESAVANGNCVKACSATVDFLRGIPAEKIHMIIIDEAAFIKDLDKILEIVELYLEKHKQIKIVIASTPHGFEKFHELYTDAVDGKKAGTPFNLYYPLNIHYTENPEYTPERIKELKKIYSDFDFRVEYEAEFLSKQSPAPFTKSNLIQVRLDDEMLRNVGSRLIQKDTNISKYIRELIENDLNSNY